MTTLKDRAIEVLTDYEEHGRNSRASMRADEEVEVQQTATNYFIEHIGSLLSGELVVPAMWEVTEVWTDDERIVAYATIGDIRFMYEESDDTYAVHKGLRVLDTCPICFSAQPKSVRVTDPVSLGEALKAETFVEHTRPELAENAVCDGRTVRRVPPAKVTAPSETLTDAEVRLVLALREVLRELVPGEV